MKFAIWLLVIIAGLSLVALLINEFLPPELIARRLYRQIGIVDPFRSWWFRALLGLLFTSLLMCIIDRIPTQFRLAFRPSYRTKISEFTESICYIKAYNRDAIPVVENLLKNLNLKARRQIGDGWTALNGMSGGISRLGPVALHLGMLMLIIGALIASITNYNTRVSAFPGDTIDLPQWGFKVKVDTFYLDYYPVGVNMWVEAPGGLRAKVSSLKGDSAEVNLVGHNSKIITRKYALTDLKTNFMITEPGGGITPYQGNVRSYISDVTVFENDVEIKKHRIEVNHPLRYKNYRFYQSSFETVPVHSHIDSLIILCISDKYGETSMKVPISGAPQALPWDDYSLQVVQFFSDFRLDENMRPISISEKLNNPVARIKLYNKGQEVGATWAFKGMMGHSGSADFPIKCILMDVAGVKIVPPRFKTIFEVYSEKGREFIWLGLLLSTLGLLLTYLVNQHIVWALIIPHTEYGYELHLTAYSQREHSYFYDKFKQAVRKLGLID